jgi:hypothetical protein
VAKQKISISSPKVAAARAYLRLAARTRGSGRADEAAHYQAVGERLLRAYREKPDGAAQRKGGDSSPQGIAACRVALPGQVWPSGAIWEC